MEENFLLFVGTGFVASLIDGALGMAFGVTASSLLLAIGVPPAVSSATVHVAKCFTGAASALSHHAMGNISADMFKRLLLPGVLGGFMGAFLVTRLCGDHIKPFVSGYLIIMGVMILAKAFNKKPPELSGKGMAPLGFCGGFLDAIGGGGWGPIVTTTLVARGNNVRETVGSVNAVEFFVAVSASMMFFMTLGFDNWQVILGLALGGMTAAPFGAWLCKHVPVKPFMIAVGLLVISISSFTLIKTLM